MPNTKESKNTAITPDSRAAQIQETFMLKEHAPAELTDRAAKVQQTARERILALLV